MDHSAALVAAEHLLKKGQYRNCHRLLTDALEVHPGSPDLLQGLGLALHCLGRSEEALGFLDRALAAAPHHAEAHFTRSVVLLALGRYREGFAEYEWRVRRAGAHDPRYYRGRRRWEGEPLGDGEELLLHCEQGFGDALQFVRYLPRVLERVRRVHLACRAELRRLFAASFPGLAGIVAGSEPMPGARFHCPLLSLPRLFGTEWETVPAPIPYLAGPTTVAAAPPALLRVGLAWRASPASATFATRSLRLTDLLPLSGLPVRWVSLQHDLNGTERNLLTHMFSAEERGSGCADFAATAEALADVDLLLSADTAPVHLAGALGKPVWTLLPFATSWRWGLNRPDTPWYPAMTLLRQATPGDWSPPVAEAARRLETWAATA